MKSIRLRAICGLAIVLGLPVARAQQPGAVSDEVKSTLVKVGY